MAATYTNSLRLVMQGVGDNNTTWGTIFNQQFAALIDQAISGYASVALADANYTLTASNGAADQARYMALNFTGALTAARTITIPAVTKLYFLGNATTGGFGLTVTTGSGTTVTIPNGGSACVLCDATNVFIAFSEIGNATTNGISVGYLNVPQNSQAANYTLVLSDAGKHIYHPASDTTIRVYTIPANATVAYPIGTTITFVNDIGNTVQIGTASPDVLTLAGSGSTGTRLLGMTGVATAIKVTATSWIISGTAIS